MNQRLHSAWPALSYQEMESTLYLLHRVLQIIGKLKLLQPFELHWANSALWLTGSGLTSGVIPYKNEHFEIDINFLDQRIYIICSWGEKAVLSLTSMSVAELTEQFFQMLRKLNIEIQINMIPAEIANPIAMDQDTEKRIYQPNLALLWWKALAQIYRVMQRYHSLFSGISPPVGLMWGTMDLRDVRYKGKCFAVPNMDYIRKNAMDDEQIEIGWWAGNPQYPSPAFFSFTYPQPPNIEKAKIKPNKGRWEPALGEFILDYQEIQQSTTPDQDLLDFFNSTYQAGAERAGWDPSLIVSGKPQK